LRNAKVMGHFVQVHSITCTH